MDRNASPGSNHSDQLGLTRIGLKILRGTRTDLKIFRRYKKYDLPQTSSCIGLHFMQQQPGKMDFRCKIVGSAILLHLQCHASSVFNTGSQFPDTTHDPFTTPLLQSRNVPSSILATTNFFLFPSLLFLGLLFILHTCICLIFYQKTHIFVKKKKKKLLGGWK